MRARLTASGTSMTGSEGESPAAYRLSRLFEHKNSLHGQGMSTSEHWLHRVFNQSLPTTTFDYTHQPSACFGQHLPDVMARMDETYANLIELPFENDDLIVRLYWRPEDGNSKFFCRTILPGDSSRDCCVWLGSLNVMRSFGPFLRFFLRDSVSPLWAELKFPNYEGIWTRRLPLMLSFDYAQTRAPYFGGSQRRLTR